MPVRRVDVSARVQPRALLILLAILQIVARGIAALGVSLRRSGRSLECHVSSRSSSSSSPAAGRGVCSSIRGSRSGISAGGNLILPLAISRMVRA